VIWVVAFLCMVGFGLLGWSDLSFMAKLTDIVVVGVCVVLMVGWGIRRLRRDEKRSE
jgi:membrane protein DedA with SNARE-associated domain